MKIPGAEEWSAEAVSARIDFELNIAEGAEFLLQETARGDNYANPDQVARLVPSDAIFAFGRAAELAFASDDFSRGADICFKMLNDRRVAPKTPLQSVFLTTVGALFGVFEVVLDPIGARIISASPAAVHRDQQRLNWPKGNSVHALKLVSSSSARCRRIYNNSECVECLPRYGKSVSKAKRHCSN